MLVFRRCPKAASSLSLSARHLSEAPAFPRAAYAPNDTPPRRAREPGHSDSRPSRARGRKPLTGAEQDALTRSAFVSPWLSPRSVVDSFAHAQVLEETYGPLKDINVPRDPDYPTYSLPYFWATFTDPSAAAAIPENGEVIQTKLPPDSPSWGPGLDDLQGLTSWRSSASSSALDSPSWTIPASEPSESHDASASPSPENAAEWQSVDLRVERAKTMPLFRPFIKRRGRIFSDRKRYDFGEAWLSWGGFASGAEAPRPNMDRVTQEWSLEVDRLAPRFASAKSTAEDAHAEAESEVVDAEALETIVEDAVEAEVQAEQVADPPTSTPRAPRLVLPIDVPLAWQPIQVPIRPEFSSTPTSETSSETKPTSTAPLSRRERLLQAARENARAPLPESASPDVTKQQAITEEEQKKAQRQSIKDRLWKLMGGRGFDS